MTIASELERPSRTRPTTALGKPREQSWNLLRNRQQNCLELQLRRQPQFQPPRLTACHRLRSTVCHRLRSTACHRLRSIAWHRLQSTEHHRQLQCTQLQRMEPLQLLQLMSHLWLLQHTELLRLLPCTKLLNQLWPLQAILLPRLPHRTVMPQSTRLQHQLYRPRSRTKFSAKKVPTALTLPAYSVWFARSV